MSASCALLAEAIRGIPVYMGPNIEMLPCDENRVTLSDHARDMFGDPLAHLHLSFTEQDLRTLDRARALVTEIFGRLGVDEIRQGPLTWSRHHIGTCRLGDNPETSVTNRNLRVHETPNLYVLGSETFVTGAAVTPVLTITALAHRLAAHIVDTFAGGGPARRSSADPQPVTRPAVTSA